MKIKIALIALLLTTTLCGNAQNIYLSEASSNTEASPVVLNEGHSLNTYVYDAENLNEALQLANEPHPMEKIGKKLTFIGLPLALLGGIMVSGADALYYECYNGVCDGDPRGGFGVIILAAGVGLTGTGVVLWAIGKSKR